MSLGEKSILTITRYVVSVRFFSLTTDKVSHEWLFDVRLANARICSDYAYGDRCACPRAIIVFRYIQPLTLTRFTRDKS